MLLWSITLHLVDNVSFGPFPIIFEPCAGRRPELILLTEVSIAGGRSRIALASTLKEAWTKALLESGADLVDIGIMDDEKAIEDHGSCSLITSDPNKMMLASCKNASILDSVKLADQLLKSRSRDQPALIVITGSLHVVSSLLAALHHWPIPTALIDYSGALIMLVRINLRNFSQAFFRRWNDGSNRDTPLIELTQIL